ncbi:MAG: flagellar filament capping protein FliD [Gemmatimonadetes bacterium]|nr:flagellar filament capping protein FliD [Gemmatimonadota bacterium]
MSQGITFQGLGSGLDTGSIIEQLVAIEQRPVTLIQERQVRLETQKLAITDINSSLLGLKSKAENLADVDLFSITKINSSDSSKVSVSATNDAAAGSINVEVKNLAQSRSLSSRSFTTTDQDLGLAGEFVINGESIELEAEDDLVEVRDAINAAGAGVNAQILTVADGDNRMIVTAEEVGAAGFDLRDASSEDVLQGLGLTSAATTVKNTFADGARSIQFLSDTDSVGTLLNLGSPPSGTITIAEQDINIDLATDSLTDIADSINAAGIAGVTAAVGSVDEGGLTRYQLEIQGTTEISDNTGVLETMGVLDSGGAVVDEIIAGAETDAFTSTTTALGSMLGLGTAPQGTISIAGQNIAVDLAEDNLTDIQTRINDAGIAGVTATVTTSSDEDGNSQFRLRIDGTSDFADDGNVLESLGVLSGSNSAFESVARVLTANAPNQARGAILNPVGANGAKSAEVASDADPLSTIIGSTASGNVSIAGTQVAIDLNTDSLNDVRDKINAAGISGVTATVNATGPATFELEISGTQVLDDDGDVLADLGIVGANTTASVDTRFGDIANGNVQAGDTISISGRNRDGDQVAGTFTISNNNLRLDNLLSTVEGLFGGDVTGSVDAMGRISLADNITGSSSLSLTLTANNEGGGSLSFGDLSVTTQGADARSSELQAGRDAQVTINGITLSRSTNTITDAVEGVTLTLNDTTEENEVIEVSVTKDDTTQLRGKLEEFVAEFNTAMGAIQAQMAVDTDTGEASTLTGDSTILGVQSRLRSAIISEVAVDGEFNALVFMGISFTRSGELTIDNDRLTEALENNLQEVQALFVENGNATDSNVEFVRSTAKTLDGDYSLDVTQAAQQAQLLGSLDLSDGLAEDQTVTISEVGGLSGAATIALAAGDTTDEIVDKINSALSSEVAEVRRGSVANTTDGTTAVNESTAFADIFGAGVVDGDSIRIQGTKHDGSAVVRNFDVDDAATQTVGDLLDEVRSTFGNNISANIDAEGRILVTDNQVGPSSLTVTLVEENEGGGNLDFGSIDVETEGRFPMEITAVNQDGQLLIKHDTFGDNAGFSIDQSVDQLGLSSDEVRGTDVAGTINGEAATGFGRILTGSRDNATTDGLTLRLTMTQDEIDADGSDRGTVNLVYGVGRSLVDTLSFITDDIDGTLRTREDAIDDTIENLDDQVAALERRVAQTRSQLVRKFATLEGSLATLQSQGDFLSSQLAGLSTGG